jgi:hypothetical protein
VQTVVNGGSLIRLDHFSHSLAVRKGTADRRGKTVGFSLGMRRSAQTRSDCRWLDNTSPPVLEPSPRGPAAKMIIRAAKLVNSVPG